MSYIGYYLIDFISLIKSIKNFKKAIEFTLHQQTEETTFSCVFDNSSTIFMIGRQKGCDIKLPEKNLSLSRMHFMVILIPEKNCFCIFTFGSLLGIKILEKCKLQKSKLEKGKLEKGKFCEYEIPGGYCGGKTFDLGTKVIITMDETLWVTISS